MSVRIVLIDENDIVREGLKLLFAQDGAYAVIGEARNGRDALRIIAREAPDIIIMEIRTPRLDGIKIARRIRGRHEQPKIIAFSLCTEPVLIRHMLAAGASAYVCKERNFPALRHAVDRLHADKRYRMPAALRMSLRSASSDIHKLSVRERDTLALLAGGKSSKDIARTLSVGLKSVEAYRHRLREKLGRASVADLTRYAIQEGIVSQKV